MASVTILACVLPKHDFLVNLKFTILTYLRTSALRAGGGISPSRTHPLLVATVLARYKESSFIAGSKDVKHGQLLSRRTTVVTTPRLCWIPFTHKVKPCVDFKTSPFLMKLDTDFFSTVTNVQHGFLSYGTFPEATWLQYRRTRLACATIFRDVQNDRPFLAQCCWVLCLHQRY